MAILVVCPGCHKRFNVSDKFAGKKGACPQCKTEIRVPTKSEEVVVHEPQAFGPKGMSGQAVLKPISREEVKISPVMLIGVGAAILCVFIVALVLRSGVEDKTNFPMWILAGGAIALAPPVVFGGYSFLRDDDLQPHRGTTLWIRVAICSVLYAVIWAVIAFVDSYVFNGDGFSLPILAVFVGLMVLGGAGIAFVSLDLEYFSGLFHYSFYLLVSVLLRLLVGLSAFPIAE